MNVKGVATLTLRSKAKQRHSTTLREARAVLNSARQAAEKTADLAAAEARNLLETAAERGFRAGVDLLSKELRHCRDLRQSILAESSRLLSSLVMTITEEITGKLVREHPAIIREQVETALASLSEPPVKILVSPDDQSVFAGTVMRMASGAVGSSVEIETCADLPRESVRIVCETHSLHIDWRQILKRLGERLPAEQLAAALESELGAAVHPEQTS